jgi:predicted RNA-binding Zn ribbon-like protein
MQTIEAPAGTDIREAGFVLMGEPLAIDLANTIKTAAVPQVDLLGDDARNTAFWSFESHRLPEFAGVPSLTESHALRSALHSLLTRVESGAAPEAWAVSYVNEVSRRARFATELVIERPSIVTKTHWQADDPADIALSAVAQSAIDLVTGPLASRLRVCAAPQCSMMFVATNSKRRWCTPNGCGNRERVARHSRQRQDSPAH